MHFKLPLLLLATFFIDSIWTKDCAKLKSNTKLFCYYGDIKETENLCKCTHVVLPEGTETKIVQKLRKQNADVKILVTVSEFNEKLVELLKNTQVDGVELNLRKMDTKNDLMDFISTVKSKLGSEHYIAVSVPSKTESLAKNFDFKELSKQADVFILNTAFLGASQNVTFHPSRLSGLWDMQNTDSMVDLVSGLGAPLSKIVFAAPVQAFSFTLQSEKFTAPGSPATEVKSITRKELCDLMQEKGVEWTLERDQDQAGPYIFRGKQWIAFEDETSIDIKTKYARVRSLAGVALKDLSQDSETKCGSSILSAAFKGLSKQARAPRGAVLQTLEREILSPSSTHSSTVHDSPFRISRIIDTEGKIHVVRQDTRTEFECSRQGYFVHPRSCNRFYRCVKFDQRTEEYNVFEFDCPAGLTFDEKTEVCVWPGSLPHASACSGSSEIAPVPQKRFSCPTEPGYYADPENCRWFFACLDHGEPTMQAYEFRCPFGLVFDEEKLLCEWSWLVPKCGSGAAVTLSYYGGVSTNINQYDGLGVLQTVKLGGLQGPIQAAEAKTYSNVGFVGLTDKTLNDGRLFAENSARFIDASRRLGLSLKATQSLYNAGLLSEKLAAIGLSQDDFGIKNLASEVNGGLHQNFGQQDQYLVQNLNGLSLTQFQQDGSNSGYGSQSSLTNSFGAKNGQYILQSNIAGANSASYNNLYQQSSSGGIKAGQNQDLSTLEQSLQDQLSLKQQNGQIQLGLTQLNLDNAAVNRVNTEGGQYKQEYSNLGGNAYSHSYVNLGQSGLQQQSVNLVGNAHVQGLGQLSLGSEGLSRTGGEQLVQQVNLGADGYSRSQVNLDQSSQDQLTSSLKNIQLGQTGYSQIGSGQLIGGQYQQGYNKNSGATSHSYVNLAQNQGELISGNSAASQLNIEHSGIYGGSSEEERINIEGGSLKSSDNLKTTGYSNSYFNLGQSSGEQIKINQQGQLNVNQQNLELDKIQSDARLEAQKVPVGNIEQLNIGFNGYRQNGGILLQNVEINGAAGTYTDDIAQSNLNLGLDSSDFTHVTPASVSHTTASSFKSIVSATPLGSIDNHNGKQSVDTSAIEYSINNLEESKNKDAQSYNNNQATSYQFIQTEQPSFVSSTPSSVILQQDVQRLSNKDYSSIEYKSQPEISFNVPQVQYVTSTSRPVTQEVYIKTATGPSVQYGGNSKITYSQQTPIVAFSTAGEKGILSGQSYSENGGYSYDRPSVTFEETPVVSSTPSYVAEVEATTPSSATSYSYTNRAERVRYQKVSKPQVIVQQPQVVIASTPSTGSSSSYFRQDTSKITYQTPQFVQQQPQVVSSYNYIKPVTYDQPKLTLVQQPQVVAQKPSVVATSYNYVNQNQPQIQQTKSEGVSASFSYVQPEVKSQVFVQQPQIALNKQEAVVTSYNYVKPTSQSQIVFEQPQISIKQPTIVESYSVRPTIKTEIVQEVKPSISQSYSYSQQNSLNGYKYEAPQISIQEQPQVTFQKPTISSSFNVESGYKYDRPSVVFEERQKPVQPQISIQEQPQETFQKPTISSSFNVESGYKYDRPSVVFEERPKTVQPIVQQNIVQSVVQKEIQQPITQQQQVTSYQYFQPVVQQPRGFTKTSFQQEAVKTYSYSNPVRNQYVVKPASIVSTNYRAPVYKSQQVEFQGYGYPKPQVQFVEEPQAVVTNYENKVPVVEAPIVPKKAYVLGNSFQYQRTVPKVQFAKEERVYATPKPTFISTINSIVTKKVNPQPQREFIYYDSRLDNTRQNQYFQTSIPAQNEIRGYSYPEPSIKFEESPKSSNQQSYQYYQSSQVEQRPVQIQQQIFTTPRPTYQSTIKSVISQKLEPLEEQFITTPAQIQYLESTTLKPFASVTTSYLPARQRIPNVEINGYVGQKSRGYSYQYNQQTNTQKQAVVENQEYNRPVYYSTERPVEVQKVTPVTQKYFYYDSRLTGTQAPEVQYLETSTRAPIIQKTQSVEFQGYDYPKPQVSFEEDQTSYGNKIPVVEAPIVPKKAYVTTGESYIYNEKVNTQSRPVVLENFVAENYQQQNSNSQLGQIEYTTTRPTYISTVTSVVAEKQPVNQEFTYYDNRYSGNSRTRLVSQKVKSSSSRGYSYPKPKLQLLEEPQQLLTTVEVKKGAQPTILENYVSPDYQKYDVSIESSTPVTLLNQNVRQEVLRYESRPQPEIAEVTQAPIELNFKISSSTPAIVQKLEQVQPIEPFYYYDSRLSSTEVPEIEVAQEKEQVPQVYRQEITSYDSRYSTSGRQNLKIKSQPSVTIIEQEQPLAKITKEEEYTLDTSTEKQYVQIETSEPSSTYLPIRKRIRVTKPSRKYLPTSPSTTYLPSTTPATVSNEYLPIASSEASAEGGISVEDYQNFELVRKKNRPVKVVKIVRPRVKTVVVKKNDFNPFLSAKLGAQCTCTSNTLELRKEPLRIEVTDDEEDESDDGILVEKNDGETIVVENYESGKDIVTPEPEVYIKSSTVEIPSSTYRLKKVNRGRSRAQNVVIENISRKKSRVNIEASDVNIVTSRVRVKTPRIDIVADDNAEVNIETGSSRAKLVEVESGENIAINSKNFDRYGPGGLRSVSETLQGVDCQRAGLFRHPTQCNKFYSCRWDCKKNKFTLHMFNCPVHLTFDNNLGACNWPSQGPACLENTLLPSE